jgi:hypothetical protein
MRVNDFGMVLHLGGSAAVVTERFVTVLDGVTEAVLDGVGDKCVALGGVPGDPVENGADHPAGGNALL